MTDAVLVVLHAESDIYSRAVPEFGSGRNPPFLQIRLISGCGQIRAGFEILPDLENCH